MYTINITNNTIANAIINMCENLSICDSDVAQGFKYSRKKDILKSHKDGSFAKFINEIRKRQINIQLIMGNSCFRV